MELTTVTGSGVSASRGTAAKRRMAAAQKATACLPITTLSIDNWLELESLFLLPAIGNGHDARFERSLGPHHPHLHRIVIVRPHFRNPIHDFGADKAAIVDSGGGRLRP